MANSVVEAVLNATKDKRTREAMLTGARLESGWRPGAVGDQGHSFGPWQIYLPAHPGVTAKQATNPEWAAKYMLRGYQSGVRAQPESLWRRDPATAAEKAAIAAERPAQPYHATQGTPRVREAYRAASQAADGKASGAPENEPPKKGKAAQAGWFNDVTGGVWDTIARPFAEVDALLTWWWSHKMRIALICIGALMVLIGLVFFAKGSM